MINAINEHPNLQPITSTTTNENEISNENDEINITKEILIKYFKYTAHYIVASMCYMRDDQVRTYLRIF